MKLVRSWLLAAVALFAVVATASAQTTNGTISGHVADSQGLALPGVTVNASSPNLQGVRTVVTSENGDFVLSLLPSGTYSLKFELSGFETVTKTATLAPTQTLPVDATMGPAAVSETVNVVGRAADVLTQTSQVATNFNQDLIATLPTNRDINAVLLLAPAVHPSGPSGNYSIAGAMSFESLFMVNGVDVNENIRGQANNLYIEDAIQETTVATAGISAEFGRFTGGVVNVITKSGGNSFSGSFRDSYANDNWRSYTLLPAGAAVPGNRTAVVPTAVAGCGVAGTDPCAEGAQYPRDSRLNLSVPTYEYTLGGPMIKDHLWFFGAGRNTSQDSNRQLAAPVNTAYVFSDQQQRYEGKLTYSYNSNHRVQGAYTKIIRNQVNNGGAQFQVLDMASLFTNKAPQDLLALNYNGVLSPTFFVEGRFTKRHGITSGAGATTQDLINGTLMRDVTNVTRYWSPTFCGVCRDEHRDNDDVFLKGNYFLSHKGSGSHNIVFGYDTFNDIRAADNYQEGSSYRIIGTNSVYRGGVVYPILQTTGAQRTLLEYDQITQSSLGTNFRTHSIFVNDNLRWNGNVTFNLGLRFDKNHGVDSAGNQTANDSAWSPRVGVVWDPKGNGDWAVTASFAKYVAGIANSIADASSVGGVPGAFQWALATPINPDPNAVNLIDTATAIQTVFNQCKRDGNGFCTGLGAPVLAQPAGVSVRIPNSLDSPNALEYSAGISRQLGNRAAVRADYVFRNFRDFYSTRVDTSTGSVTDAFGNRSDVQIYENTSDLKRRYQGLTVSATYRVSGRTDIGGNYTLSRLWGNFDGENVASGPLTVTAFAYPEYKQAAWNSPEGDLSADQRHRTRLWINYGVPKVPALTVSFLENMSSGVPYGAVGTVDARPYVDPAIAAKYVTPQGGSSVTYFYTPRDAFRTDSEFRTDFSATLNHSLSVGGSHKLDLFAQIQVLNIFNQFQLCGCGGTVFQNGGNVQLNLINTGVLAPNGTTRPNFNPFAQTPVQGVNWDFAPAFGTASSRMAFTSPRTFRLTFGVRF